MLLDVVFVRGAKRPFVYVRVAINRNFLNIDRDELIYFTPHKNFSFVFDLYMPQNLAPSNYTDQS